MAATTTLDSCEGQFPCHITRSSRVIEVRDEGPRFDYDLRTVYGLTHGLSDVRRHSRRSLPSPHGYSRFMQRSVSYIASYAYMQLLYIYHSLNITCDPSVT